MNPVVFIVGCPRSGTTLLRRLVDAHPDVAITYETHWIAKWYERRKGVTPEGTVSPELIPRLVDYHRFTSWPIERADLERLVPSDVPVSYADFGTGFFDLYGEKRGKRLVGDKTPAYVRHIPTLHRLWPHAKFVHIIRDGRDVCLSVTNWTKSVNLARRFPTWHQDPATTAMLWWEWSVRLGREDGGSLDRELYLEARYESLVSDPATECERICDFLSIPYDDAMLRFHEGREREDPDLDAKKAWRRVTPGLRKWQSQMPAEQIESCEAAAGDLLDELGYPRAFPNPSSEVLERVTDVRDRFTRDLRAREQRLPEAWQR